MPSLGQLQASSSTAIIQQRINKSDWSNFNEANDFSYKPAAILAENTHITAYINGSLVYGQEPGVSGARVGTSEELWVLRVVVLGNPIQGDLVHVEVSGIEGQPVRLLLTDSQGRTISEHRTEKPASVERYTLPVSRQQTGTLLLQVSTDQAKQSIKLLKH